MKRLALTVLLVATPVFAAKKPDPKDFTLTIHVLSSAATLSGSDTSVLYMQVLETMIEGQPIQLRYASGFGYGVLAPGDYKARKSPDVHAPKWATSADRFDGYDLLMPDGTARTFGVTRLGPAIPTP